VLDAWGDGFAYAAVTWGEEAAEMVGAVVALCGLLAALDVRVRDGSLRLGLAQPVATPAAGPRPPADQLVTQT
jgi:hypothetical protein